MRTLMKEEGYQDFIIAVSKYLERRKKKASDNNIYPITKAASGALNPGYGQTINQTHQFPPQLFSHRPS